jgi:hypothetical protein
MEYTEIPMVFFMPYKWEWRQQSNQENFKSNDGIQGHSSNNIGKVYSLEKGKVGQWYT